MRENLGNEIWPRSISFWMAVCYVALFIIRPWDQLFPVLAEIHFERLYAVLMILTVLLSGQVEFRVDLQTTSILCFMISLGFSAAFAQNASLGFNSLYEYVTIIVFYFILLCVIRTPYHLFLMIAIYIGIISLYLCKSQWEFFINGQHRYDMGVIRMVGIETSFGSPNSLSMSIVVSLPLYMFILSIRNTLAKGWSSFWNTSFNICIFSYPFIAVTSIILTNSRSGMLSTLVFLILASAKGGSIKKKLKLVAIAILCVIFVWQLMPLEYQGRFRTIWERDANPWATESADGRIEGLQAGIEMFKRFPIFGVGIGNFSSYRAQYLDGSSLSAHNLLGQVLGETGFFGGITFLWMILSIFRNIHAVKTLAKLQRDPERLIRSRLATACRDSILLLTFEGFFGHNLMRFNWLWLAAFCSINLHFAKTINTANSTKWM